MQIALIGYRFHDAPPDIGWVCVGSLHFNPQSGWVSMKIKRKPVLHLPFRAVQTSGPATYIWGDIMNCIKKEDHPQKLGFVYTDVEEDGRVVFKGVFAKMPIITKPHTTIPVFLSDRERAA